MAPSLEVQFANFSKFGNSKSEGKDITLTQIDKWLKQAGIIDKKITTTDTAICFNKFKVKNMNYKDFVKFIEELAKEKGMNADDLKSKLTGCGDPGTNKTTQAVKVGGVDRLTDTTQYTGTHKERFDDQGKGKGIAGREDRQDGSGFVGNYKGQGTYDKTH